jgi:hypothetical protein
LKQKIAKQTETIQSLEHTSRNNRTFKKQIHTLEKTSKEKRTFKIFDGKINRICETKENWDPDCEFKGKALHKMTGQNSVTEKRTDFIEKLRKGQTEFSIPEFVEF